MSVPLLSNLGPNIRLAATTLILSPRMQPSSCGEDYNILMLKRHGRARFMPNAHVFPGGCAETVDLWSEWATFFPLSPSHHEHEPFPDFSTRMGAIRDVYEEAGIFLANKVREDHDSFLNQIARPPSQPILKLDWNDQQNAVIRSHRKVVQADCGLFRSLFAAVELASPSRLRPPLEHLMPWSRWVTPPNEKYRYDTFFYLIGLKDEHDHAHASHDANEVVEMDWFSPSEALQAFAQGRIQLAPPTWYTLQDLAKTQSLEKLFDLVHSNNHHADPIIPKTSQTSTGDLLFELDHHTIKFSSHGVYSLIETTP